MDNSTQGALLKQQGAVLWDSLWAFPAPQQRGVYEIAELRKPAETLGSAVSWMSTWSPGLAQTLHLPETGCPRNLQKNSEEMLSDT